MKKLVSIRYSEGWFNFSMLLLRVVFGGLLVVNHGLTKLTNFSTMQAKFYDFLGLGPKFSLCLVIFAEVFCSLAVVLGLFTRLAVIPILITMAVAIFGAQSGKAFSELELPIVYSASFLVLLFCGPGRYSVDSMISK